MSDQALSVEKNQFAEDQTIGSSEKKQLWRRERAQTELQSWRTGTGEGRARSVGIGNYSLSSLYDYNRNAVSRILEKERPWRNQRLKKPKFTLSSLCPATFFLLTCLRSHLPSPALALAGCKHDTREWGGHGAQVMALPRDSAEVGLRGAARLPSTDDVGLALLTDA